MTTVQYCSSYEKPTTKLTQLKKLLKTTSSLKNYYKTTIPIKRTTTATAKLQQLKNTY